MPGFYEHYVILKFHTPWLFKSSEDLRMAIFEPFYMNNKPKPYITPYGIAETTNKVFTPNFFILLQKQKRKMLIETNTPMVQILPMTEKIVEIKNEVITENEYLKYWSYVAQRPYFFSYGLKSIKKNFFGEKSKCPFGK